jgi:predicted MFS family arabinose efflux permease
LLAAAGVGFVRRELAHPDPVLEPRFFRRPAFSAATGAVALSNLAMYATLLAVPVAFSSRAGWSDEKVGLVLVPFALASVALSPVGGRLSDRAGRRPVAVAGLALFGIALLPLAISGTAVSAAVLGLTLIPAGAGLGLATPAIQTAAIEALDVRHAGVASGVFSTARYLGSIVAAGALGLAASSGGAAVEDLFWLAAATAVASAALASGVGGVIPEVRLGGGGVGATASSSGD